MRKDRERRFECLVPSKLWDGILHLTFLSQQVSHKEIHNQNTVTEFEHPSPSKNGGLGLKMTRKSDLHQLYSHNKIPIMKVAQNTRRRISVSIHGWVANLCSSSTFNPRLIAIRIAMPAYIHALAPLEEPNSCNPRITRAWTLDKVGRSNSRERSCRALAAYSSPAWAIGCCWTAGCRENLALTAHTARMRAGATVPSANCLMKVGLCKTI